MDGFESIDAENIVAKHDDMKNTLVKFIENFRIFFKNNQNDNLLSLLIKYLPEFLILDFDGASRDGSNAGIKRGELAKRNKESQCRDLFNFIAIPNVADGDYDLSNGFEINEAGRIYRLKGPLIEMTPEMLEMERNFKALNGGICFIDSQLSKYKKTNLCDLKLEHFEKLEKGYKDLIEKINTSDVDKNFKNRLLTVPNQYIVMIKRKKEKKNNIEKILMMK